ncbi:hypothetical protein DUNSADRAFT_231 [Dunaliella salina]|uniref:Uncharacterized protein n=1 Tax=Dunaliella salina TaxID=3046 RepID=A0ABQ7GYL1_DUNSA|nr:hypothetical protein DUNSADRAFT_231 [Dunaliella salina]|eukprot:KAF5839680.1 hypothetical protein DUNSADRAFT_231 [Dunaliella salina]
MPGGVRAVATASCPCPCMRSAAAAGQYGRSCGGAGRLGAAYVGFQGPPNLGTQGQVELPGILGSSFYDTAQLWQSPSPSTRSAKAKQQQDEDHSILLRTGRQLLHQAISWGLCNVADLVLQGMLRKPFSLSFTELANGVPAHAHPNSFEEKMVGSFEDDESPSPRRSFEEELENCPESLLNLALLSRSPAMFGRVLEWGRTYGKPGFEWDWLFKDINEITPLQRMQVLCSTHPEMLEMALADTHAGPGLLACWLQRETHAAQQQGPIDKLPPQHSTPSTQAPTSPPSVSAADMAAAPAATQASSNRSATQASSSSSADVRHGHQAADLAAAPAATQASSSGAPNKASPTPANNHTIATEELAAPPLSSSSLLLKGGAAPAPRVCMLADTHQMRLPYFVWLLRSEVWGFRGGDAQAAGLRPQAACASGFCREVANLRSPVQQQQQQVANTHSPVQPQQQVDKENPPSNTAELSVISSESQYALSEVQYRAWAVHKAAPRLWKLSIVSTVLPLLLLASPLTIADSISEMEWRFQQPTAPVCCGLSLLSLTTLVLVSKLNTTVTPHTLQAWLSIAAVLRAVGYILLGSGILQGLERHPGFGFLGCIVLVWEAAASVVEQVHFFLGVAVRVPLIAIHATLWVKGAPSLAVPAVLLHSACAALWLAHSLKQRSTFVSMHAAAKARKAE